MNESPDRPISGTGPRARVRGLFAVVRTPGCLVAIVFIGATIALGRWVESIGGPEALIERYGLAAPILTVPIHAVLAVSPFPSELFVIANGAAYGWALGALLGWLGWILGSILEYWLVRRSVGRARDERPKPRKLPRWLQRFPVKHPVFQICGRWVPLGYHVVNISSGASRVPFGRFAWCTVLSCAPLAGLFAGIGAGIQLF